MRVAKEFLLLAFVGFVFWLFLTAVVPIPYGFPPGFLDEVPPNRWGVLMRADLEIQARSFLACVVGFPLAAMAVRRLR